jgi:uncharacterized membrane protein YphA (DoxX/SURF4 family)
MLNPFPILFLALLAHFLLRVFVGSILLYLGILHMQCRHDMKHALAPKVPMGGLAAVWMLALTEIIVGVMFIAGFYTQISALICMVLALKLIVFNRRFASPRIPSRLFFVLLFATSLSLFITGAGAFAFDLPL